jgi:hypothetical protein
MTAAADSDGGSLEPLLCARDLPIEVARRRAAAEVEHAEKEAFWQPRIDMHLEVYSAAVETLIEHHRQVADHTDLEIGSTTRWSATWELGGRCLAIARVVLHDARGGFCSESDGTLRALHEAVQILSAISFEQETALLRRWLAGKEVAQRDARKVVGRMQAFADERMRAAGVEPVEGDLPTLGLKIYGALSTSAHHQRGGFPEALAPALRQFAYGPHPDVERRAGHLNFVGELLEETVIVVGSAFATLHGGDYRDRVVVPLQDAMAQVRVDAPLPE